MNDELQTLRRLANDLVRAQGKYLSHEDLIVAFVERSKRLVHNDALMQYLADVKAADDKFERLMALEESIVGAENKRTLAAFAFPIVTSNAFEQQVAAGAGPAQRLKRFADLQGRAMRA
jgi:hypothetical protein